MSGRRVRAQDALSPMYDWRRRRTPIEQEAVARIGLQGHFHLVHLRDGVVIEEREFPNLIVNAGLAAVAGLIIATGHTNAFDYIAIGTGTTAPAAGNTTLETEITTGGGARALATLSRVTTTVTNDSSRLVKTFTFTSSFAVTEAGVFDTSAAGTMLCRQTFTAINVVSTDTLAVTYTIAVA